MNKSRGPRIVPKTFRIRNPLESPLVVWIEPWADRHELPFGDTLEVTFVGPEQGFPVFLPADRSLAIYGWEECDVVVLQNGRVAGHQPSVREIVEQELDIALDSIEFKGEELPGKEIEDTQRALDCHPDLSADGQSDACRIAGFLIWELANCLKKSPAATTLLWNIARRVVRTKGLILIEPGVNSKASAALWKSLPASDHIFERSISSLPDGPNSMQGLPIRRRHDEAQSGSA